jgi:hypothetical protein
MQPDATYMTLDVDEIAAFPLPSARTTNLPHSGKQRYTQVLGSLYRRRQFGRDEPVMGASGGPSTQQVEKPCEQENVCALTAQDDALDNNRRWHFGSDAHRATFVVSAGVP